MDKVTTAERLNQIMEETGLRQTDIVRRCQPFCAQHNVKMNKSDISQYVSGKNLPNQDKLFVLGKALNVTEAWLMGYDVPRRPEYIDNISHLKNIIPLPQSKKQVPLVGTIACGQPILAFEDTDENGNYEFVDLPDGVKADFALKCQGDSMIHAGINNGDTVFVLHHSTVPNGAIAAVRLNDDATLKRVYYKPDSIILQPCNPMYEPETYSRHDLKEMEVIGIATAVLSRLNVEFF